MRDQASSEIRRKVSMYRVQTQQTRIRTAGKLHKFEDSGKLNLKKQFKNML